MAADTQVLKGETHTDPATPSMDVQKLLESLLLSLLAEQQGERTESESEARV